MNQFNEGLWMFSIFGYFWESEIFFFFLIFRVFIHPSIKLRYWNTASIAKVIYGNITLAVFSRRYKWSQGGVTLHPGISSLHVCAAHLNGSRQEGICLHMSPQVITVKVPTCCEKWTWCHSHSPRTDRLCLSCRLPLAATRGSRKDVIRWWVGYPNPNLKKKPC